MGATSVVLKKNHYDADTDKVIVAGERFTVKAHRGEGLEKELCCGGGEIEFWVLETKTNPIPETSTV